MSYTPPQTVVDKASAKAPAEATAKATERSEMFADVRAGASEAHPECSPAFGDVRERSEVFAQMDLTQSKPNSTVASSPPLTPRQLAAVRLLTRGMTSTAVAAALATTQQTINRWRRSAGFGEEIRRLHELLVVAPAAARTQPTPVRQSAARSSADAERRKQRDFEAVVDRLLAPPRLR